MLVSVNNQSVTLPLACSLAGLVDHFGFQNPKGMAIAVNQQIIPKSTWDQYTLNENDQVTIIHATQGG